MKRILSLVVILVLLSNTFVFAVTGAKYELPEKKQGYFDLDIEMYQKDYSLNNPQVIYIQKPDGRKYEGRDLEELFSKNNTQSKSDDDFTILQIPIDPGTTRIVTGNASVSSWVIRDSISKRTWNLLKGLTLAVIGFIINPVGGFILGAGDAVISNAVTNSHQVESVSQFNNRTLRKIGEAYDGSKWVPLAEFQRWEEYWQKYTYTYDSQGRETNSFRYVSFPGASGRIILPNTPTKTQQYVHYNDNLRLSSITYERWLMKLGYYVYKFNESGANTSVNNSTWWQNYVNSKTIQP
ncbi:hypothetical protein SAMN05661008_01828 [Alkalithermobacter thermoalcaliphilus JW-YL-7 = DSM 7308]|uniref:Uncharacterized protein n=1 Tax=Alkalithermobacter thermoalcaliphilus JW-YL-7 = DSM 7308 TaxID=1121328 RepID=A0A150FSH4_CLOPD|nr:hypothetical protein JWYL7_1055 [[Clostridium] paradoxum JW-YL-7 = DSM 7308]SHL29571.1 hypothetical protein SAMN05661008_01828 [[Clostridium] paradoxum JW-YL-7 = DSM 7308]